ncbi:hypothetical protein LINPERHAP2_LOCUS3394 [Linum perenne]
MAVWIKLSRVPSHCVTTCFGREFLPFFGELLDISLFGSRGRDAVFIKGLVRIDLLASFLGRRLACGPDNIPFWVRLHYENISSICYRCGFLGHASLRCPHMDIPLDHEARGSWMSIGRVGFRIMENSLQKYIQNQIKAKRSEPENSDIGQFSFVTKEKRFGYSVQLLVDESGSDEKDAETGSFAASSKQPGSPSASRKVPKDGAMPPIGRGPHQSDGVLARRKQAPLPQTSTPAGLINKDKMVKAGAMKGSNGLYIHPRRRMLYGKAAFSCSKGKDKAAAPTVCPPLGPTVVPHQHAVKRKLTFEGKGKGKMIEGAASIPVKRWVPSKGITIREPNSREALPNSTSSAPSRGNKISVSPHRLAGPSRIGEWIERNMGAQVTDERVEIPHKCFERKSYSLELIRNLYQQDEDDEAEDEDEEERRL